MKNHTTKVKNGASETYMSASEVVNYLITEFAPPLTRAESRPINRIQDILDDVEGEDAPIPLSRKQWVLLARVLTHYPMPSHRNFTSVIDMVEAKAKEEDNAADEE